ncbi:MAG: EI24 domain-containing protein [Verrucomicrobiales bacterium]|nr:EI24 domain-containing protein [Verrucomicrobiales bacterium]
MSGSTNPKRPRKLRRSFVPGLALGLGAYLRVIPTLFRYKLWPAQFVPALLSLLISVGMITAFWFTSNGLTNWIDEQIQIPWEWMDETINSFSFIISLSLMILCFLLVHKHIILVVLAPFLGKLAELTYRAVMNDNSTSPLTVPQSISRGMRINMANITKELFINFLFLCCNVVPGIGQVLASVGVFLNQSRFMGFGLMDFPLEHKGLTVKESLRFVRYRTGCSTGVGAGYIVLMLIPLLGWMFAPTFGTIAGTLVAIHELEVEEKHRLETQAT